MSISFQVKSYNHIPFQPCYDLFHPMRTNPFYGDGINLLKLYYVVKKETIAHKWNHLIISIPKLSTEIANLEKNHKELAAEIQSLSKDLSESLKDFTVKPHYLSTKTACCVTCSLEDYGENILGLLERVKELAAKLCPDYVFPNHTPFGNGSSVCKTATDTPKSK